MPSKKTKIVNGALLGAAATALTVNGTISSPLGGTTPVGDLKHTLEGKKNDAMAQSSQVLTQVATDLLGAVVRVPPNNTVTISPVPSVAAQTRSARNAVRDDPPARGDPSSPAAARRILERAAMRHQLDPRLVLALSYWESGWDQSLVSATGAVGLMQVEPATAQEAGPSLLGRPVDINDPYDNADVGAAILRQDLDAFNNPALALAAYYQGPTSLRANGMLPDTQQYVDGILSLASRM